jgi:hypothetical protein
MARRTRVSVYLDRAAIDRLTLPGGMIYGYLNRLAHEVQILAVTLAPSRTGALRASIRLGGGSFNQYGVSERVNATAPHAKYVLRGTTGPIYANDGGLMPVGKSQIGGLYPRALTFTRVVSGQQANNFLREALVSVMRAHGL